MMKRIAGLAGIALFIVASAGKVVAEYDADQALRSFSRFSFDPHVVSGGWVEFFAAGVHEEDASLTGAPSFFDSADIDQVEAGAQLAFGHRWFETGLFLPYRHLSVEFVPVGVDDVDEHGVGDISIYGKMVPFDLELVRGAIGLEASVPSGDEDEGLGYGDFALRPFGSIDIGKPLISVRAHMGYEKFISSSLADSWLYGTGIFSLPCEWFGARAEILGQSVRRDGENADLLTFQPGVEFRIPTDEVGVLFRLNGAVGITNDAPDWGAGGSIVVAWDVD